MSPAQWWRGVRNQRGKNCCRAWSRAGPCALWDSYPPPVSPFTLGATDNPPPRPHLLSSALNLWIFWWGAKTQHGTMAGPQKGPDSQNVCTQGSQRRNRKMGGGGVGLQSGPVPASLLGSHCKDSLVQTGLEPPTPGPELPGFSPRPAQNSFHKLGCQVKIRGKFLLLSLGFVRSLG